MSTCRGNTWIKRQLAWLPIVLQTLSIPSYAATPLSVDAKVAGNKPILNVSATGVPIVQIVPPNTAGVSHNRFTQYNVGAEGQVLNNSGLASTSTLVGSVGGNPLLGNSNARLILNEVTGTNPSALNGMIEITGKRADLVVANPNGISVDGGGFINASRAVLTTGRPQANFGVTSENLNVQQGQISIQGKGLDARGADQLLLLSRSLLVNADLYANGLNVATGSNQINLATGSLAAQTGTGAAPAVAVDVSNLGGMYANSIYLVGTEAGVGVNSKGKMQALTGDIQLSNAGDITVTDGQLKATWDIRANARHDMTLQGTDVQAGNNIELVAGHDLSITATRTDTSTSSTVWTTTTTNATTVHTGSVLQAGGDIALLANTEPDPALGTAASYATQRTQLENSIATLQAQLGSLKTAADNARASYSNCLNIPRAFFCSYDPAPQAAYDAANAQLQSDQASLQNLTKNYAGGMVTLSGSGVRSEGNVLASGADVSVNSLADSKLVRNVTYYSSTSCSWFGLYCTTTNTRAESKNLEETLMGGEVSALGDINILSLGNHDAAGSLYADTGNLLLLGANVKSDYGQAQLMAATDLEVEATQSGHSQLTDVQSNSQSRFIGINTSSGSGLAVDAGVQYLAEGSTVSGNNVQLNAGRDVMVRGSVLSADNDIKVVAGRDVDVIEARDVVSRQMIRQSKRSGIFGGDGFLGLTIGTTSSTQTSSTTIDTASASQIGSMAGSVSIMGGRNVQIEGADVLAGGDIDLIGDSVRIFAAKNIYNQEDSFNLRTSGLTLALKGGALSKFESAWQATQKSRRATDQRLKNAYAFKAGYDLFRAVKETPDLAAQFAGLNDGFNELLKGNPAGAKTAGINLELSLGISDSQSSFTQTQTDWRASVLSSNGDTTIIARTPTAASTVVASSGGGFFSAIRAAMLMMNTPSAGSIDIMGSKLDANNLTLSAGTALSARNSQQTSVSRETSSNTAASVGVGVGSQGLYFTASGQVGNAQGIAFKEDNGESHLTANNRLMLLSGGNADLRGTIAKANRIEADITGNLTLASLQDSERYQYRSSNAGGSITIPYPGTGNASFSVNAGSQTINNQYQSVVQQSGLFAGDGGFDIKVGGTTNLVGAAIVSNAPATLNQLTTTDLIYSDLTNYEQSNVSGYTFGFGTGPGSNYVTPAPKVGATNRSSVTQAILSPGSITATAFDQRTSLVSQQSALQTQITDLNAQLVGYPAAQAAVAQSQTRLEQIRLAIISGQGSLFWYRVYAAYYNTLFAQEQAKLAQLQAALAPLQAAQTQLDQASASLNAVTAELARVDNTLPTLTSRTLADANPALTNTFDAAKTRNTIEAMNVFSETAMRIVGDYFQDKVNAAQTRINQANKDLDAAKKSGNQANITAAQTALDTANAEMTTVRGQQVLAHGTVGGLTAALGGLDPVSGFVGGAAGKTAALVTEDLLIQNNIDPNSILYQQLTTLSATAAGAITGGSTGSFIASQGDRFNRQLHEAERLRIKKLAKDASGNVDPQKEARLTAAACALVKCYAEYPIDSLAYQELKKLADIGSTLTNELAILSSQTYGGERIFGYSQVGFLNDTFLDSVKRIDNTYQVATRSLGLLQAGLGATGMAASSAAAPACISILGCAGVVSGFTVSGDSLYTGTKQLLYGDPQSTLLNQALTTLGLSPQAANIVELTLGIGSAASMANGLSKASVQALAYDTAAVRAGNAPFTPLGLQVTPTVLASPEAQALTNAVKAANPTLDSLLVNDIVRSLLESGTALPSKILAGSNMTLVKVVPKGAGVSDVTPYFVSLDLAKQIAKMPPAQVADLLALPPANRAGLLANGMDFYAIKPVTGQAPPVFVSTIAKTAEGAPGGVQQVLVVNRSSWTAPERIQADVLFNL